MKTSRRNSTRTERSSLSASSFQERIAEAAGALRAGWAERGQSDWSQSLRSTWLGLRARLPQPGPARAARRTGASASDSRRRPAVSAAPAEPAPVRAAEPSRRAERGEGAEAKDRRARPQESQPLYKEGRFSQAYRQAPGRRQLQMAGWFALTVIGVWLVAGFYLNISSRTATLGRQIQEMQVRFGGSTSLVSAAQDLAIVAPAASGYADAGAVEEQSVEIIPMEELRIQITDLQTQLAMLTSANRLHQRALELGFEPLDPAQIVYLPVSGYQPAALAQLAPSNTPQVAAAYRTPTYFHDSLFDVVAREWRNLLEMAEDSSIFEAPPGSVAPEGGGGVTP